MEEIESPQMTQLVGGLTQPGVPPARQRHSEEKQ